MWLLLFTGCDVVSDVVADKYCIAADPDEDIEYTVEVPSGTTSRTLGAILEEDQIINSGADFTTCVRMTNKGECAIKAGRFKLSRDMDVDRIFEVVCGDPIPDEGVPLTITPGWRIREIDAALAKEGLTLPGEYRALVTHPKGFEAPFPLPTDSLEGYLFPETYEVNPGKWDTKEFIQRQINTLSERFYEPNQAAILEATQAGRDIGKLIIMASMLEREEPTVEQRPLVAGIIWKRLDSDWELGIDATSRYTLDVWNDRAAFLKKLGDPSDPYNTRKRLGLPPTAIGNPTLSALESALNPQESKYWYYLHDHDKILRPAINEKQHEENRRKYNVY